MAPSVDSVRAAKYEGPGSASHPKGFILRMARRSNCHRPWSYVSLRSSNPGARKRRLLCIAAQRARPPFGGGGPENFRREVVVIADQAFSDLVGLIYDCALDKDRWSEVLERLCGATKAEFGELSVTNVATRQWSVAAAHNWPRAALEEMAQNLAVNPLVPLGLVYDVGKPFCGSRDYGVEAMRRTPYWQRCMKPFAVHDIIAVSVTRTVPFYGQFSITSTDALGPFSNADIELVRMVAATCAAINRAFWLVRAPTSCRKRTFRGPRHGGDCGADRDAGPSSDFCERGGRRRTGPGRSVGSSGWSAAPHARQSSPVLE